MAAVTRLRDQSRLDAQEIATAEALAAEMERQRDAAAARATKAERELERLRGQVQQAHAFGMRAAPAIDQMFGWLGQARGAAQPPVEES